MHAHTPQHTLADRSGFVMVVIANDDDLDILSGLFHFVLCLRAPHLACIGINIVAHSHRHSQWLL